MYKILRKNLAFVYEKIASSYALYLPVLRGGEVNYGFYENADEVSLDTLKTVTSPKDIFFPQSEKMMKFKTEGKNVEVKALLSENGSAVVFGVKACDEAAFSVLDKVFLSDPVDGFYKKRRENTTVVSLACSRPEESCFCGTFGIDPAEPKGDVTTWLTDECLFWRANTEKGEALTALLSDVLEDCDEKSVEEQRANTSEILKKLPFAALDLSKFKAENLKELFDSPKWAELSEACLGCGTCTFSCPTCQCFDVRDFKTKDGALRFRCWDSCMYSDFTLMAHGNSRNTQLQRFRQRFMHKLVYYPSQYGGTFSCVGCGRCVNKCPQNLNIVKVIKAFGGEKK